MHDCASDSFGNVHRILQNLAQLDINPRVETSIVKVLIELISQVRLDVIVNVLIFSAFVLF